MAAAFAGLQPATIAAVTGTNGKILDRPFRAPDLGSARPQGGERRHAGHRLAGARRATAASRRPIRCSCTRISRRWRAKACRHLAIEASSHGLDQHRLDGLRLAAAAFTNLTHEHLDYHASMDAYFAAKARLFDGLLPRGGTAVVNADSDRAEALAAICRQRGIRFWTYGAQGRGDPADRATIRRRPASTSCSRCWARAMRSSCRWSAASRHRTRWRRSASWWRRAAIRRAPWRRWRA